MTVKLSVSLPDDVAEFLQGQGNVSGFIADTVRDRMPEARRARLRAAAAELAHRQSQRTADEIAADRELQEHQHELLLRDGDAWE